MSDLGAEILQSKRNAIKVFGLAILAIAISIFAWQKSAPLTESAELKPIGAWIERDYASGQPPDIIIFGDSQIGGLRSADAKVAKRKLDFALDHRSYAIEHELRKRNAPSRLDLAGGLSKLGISNTLTRHKHSSHFPPSGPTVFVASQPGSIASDYYAMSKTLITKDRKPAIAIITVNPRTFLDNGLSCPGDSDYFRFFAKRTNFKSSIYEVAYPDLRSKFNAVKKTILRSPVNQVAVRQFVFLPDDKQRFNDRFIYPPNFSFDATSCGHQIWFLNETLKHHQELNVKSIVVSLPLMHIHSTAAFNKLHDSIKGSLQTTCKNKNADYFDLTNDSRFAHEDFLDPVHLSQSGGTKLANIVSKYAIDSGFPDTSQTR